MARSDITEKVRMATEAAEQASVAAAEAEAVAAEATANLEAVQARARAALATAAAEKAKAEDAARAVVAATADLRCACGNRRLVPTVILGPDGNPTADGQDVFACPACDRVHRLNTDGETVRLETMVAHGSLVVWRGL